MLKTKTIFFVVVWNYSMLSCVHLFYCYSQCFCFLTTDLKKIESISVDGRKPTGNSIIFHSLLLQKLKYVVLFSYQNEYLINWFFKMKQCRFNIKHQELEPVLLFLSWKHIFVFPVWTKNPNVFPKGMKSVERKSVTSMSIGLTTWKLCEIIFFHQDHPKGV